MNPWLRCSMATFGISVILFIYLCCIMMGCARVNLGLEDDGKIGFDKAGGYCSPERGLAIKKMENLPVLQPDQPEVQLTTKERSASQPEATPPKPEIELTIKTKSGLEVMGGPKPASQPKPTPLPKEKAEQKGVEATKNKSASQPKTETPEPKPSPERTGYYGIIYNEDRYYPISIKISGPERQSFKVLPTQTIDVWLIPGKYTAKFFKRGSPAGTENFTVDGRISNYQGKRVHWYLGWAR